MTTAYLPILASESGLSQYMAEINRFPMLTEEEELSLSRRWISQGDVAAAHKLVTSHLRLVAKIAFGFKNYGLPIRELISEGNIGLMKAVKRFDPEKGFRLATYAMWWIKASIQEYILHSWSLVKIGTTRAQKKLFFNLRKLKHQIRTTSNRSLGQDEVAKIASTLSVSEDEVREMDMRLSHADTSLNQMIGHDDHDEELINTIEHQQPNHEIMIVEHQYQEHRHALLGNAMDQLSTREQDIIKARYLKEEPDTLEQLSLVFHISRERVRQIEVRAMQKLQQYMLSNQVSS